MRDVMTVLGVLAVIGMFAMILKCPDTRENFSKEHYKSLIYAIGPMIVLMILVAYLMSHVGL